MRDDVVPAHAESVLVVTSSCPYRVCAQVGTVPRRAWWVDVMRCECLGKRGNFGGGGPD